MDLNIRGVPEELGKAVRVKAAQENLAIREWVIKVLEHAVTDSSKIGQPVESIKETK